MYLVQLKRFHDVDKEQNIFVPALFGRVDKPKAGRPPGRLWDKESFLDQASKKAADRLPILERLIEFAEGEKAIGWGRGASIGTFQFVFPTPYLGPNRKSLSAFSVMAIGRIAFDFWTLSRWLDEKIVASYRDNLALALHIPAEAISTDKWREFDVTALTSEEAWEALKQAVLNLRATVSESGHDS